MPDSNRWSTIQYLPHWPGAMHQEGEGGYCIGNPEEEDHQTEDLAFFTRYDGLWKQASNHQASGEPLTGLAWPEPEDRGHAKLSEMGDAEYVEDLIRPGRIVVWAAEEGSGKTYAVTGELAIRAACAGGAFAGTWPVLQTGPVLVLSEMHADDDYLREEEVLTSLGRDRVDLMGRYFRLPIITAAGGKPPLMEPAWRDYITGWLKDRGALMLVVDTATGATNVDPWGEKIQAVYTGLRLMQTAYPALAVVLVVHLKKPQGHGERRISDVLGEWGRWCDVVVLQQNDGASLIRTKLTVRKRVRRERRIVATKAGGLLVNPQEAALGGGKVSPEHLVAAVVMTPGISMRELAKALSVSISATSGYVAAAELEGTLEIRPGKNRSKLVYPAGYQVESPS